MLEISVSPSCGGFPSRHGTTFLNITCRFGDATRHFGDAPCPLQRFWNARKRETAVASVQNELRIGRAQVHRASPVP